MYRLRSSVRLIAGKHRFYSQSIEMFSITPTDARQKLEVHWVECVVHFVQRWAFFKNWLKRSATKRKSSVKSLNATQLAQPNF